MCTVNDDIMTLWHHFDAAKAETKRTCCLDGWLFSANHFCNLGISVSGSKQILIRGLATVNPAAAAAEEAVTAASRSTTDEDVDEGGGGGCRNDGGGAKFKFFNSRCWSSSDAAALVSPQIADSRSFGGEFTSMGNGIYVRGERERGTSKVNLISLGVGSS